MTRVALVACSATKLGHAAKAAELYNGDMFRLTRRIVEHPEMDGAFAQWGILSAKHGLVLPEQVIEPYDTSLSGMSREEVRAWEDRVAQQLVNQWGAGAIYRAYAGRDYLGWERRVPFVEDVFGYWARSHRDDGKRSRFGIGHIRRRLGIELRALDEAVARRAWLEAHPEEAFWQEAS